MPFCFQGFYLGNQEEIKARIEGVKVCYYFRI